MTSSKLKSALCGGAFVAVAVLVTGCGTEYLRRDDTLTTYSGDAVRRNIAIQTINPNPNHAYRNHIHTSGQRMEGAMARYNSGGADAPASEGVEQEAELQEPPAPDEPG